MALVEVAGVRGDDPIEESSGPNGPLETNGKPFLRTAGSALYNIISNFVPIYFHRPEFWRTAFHVWKHASLAGFDCDHRLLGCPYADRDAAMFTASMDIESLSHLYMAPHFHVVTPLIQINLLFEMGRCHAANMATMTHLFDAMTPLRCCIDCLIGVFRWMFIGIHQ